MNLDHIETFLYVVHLKSIRKASKALFLSQPTVTARIQSLEKELNIQLFLRVNRELILTEEGKNFIPYAQKILNTLKESKKHLANKIDQNIFRIGSNEITAQYFLAGNKKNWYPNQSKVQLKIGSTAEHIHSLLNDELDIAFIRKTNDPSLYQEKIIENPIQLIVYPGHSFEAIKNVSIHELSKEQLVLFECGAFDWSLFRKIFEIENIQPNIQFEVNHLNVAKQLIKQKQCIGFLPLLCVREELENGELIAIDTSDLLHMEQDIYATYSKDKPFKNIENILLELRPVKAI